MYEEMIVTGAWWDHVDEIARRRVGLLLQRFPRPLRRTMLAWSRDDDLWKRPLSVREALKNMPQRLRGVG
jgi:hypothetical protein